MKIKVEAKHEELEGAEEIFAEYDRVTPATFKAFTTLLVKKGFLLAFVKTKRSCLPKVPMHQPVAMKVPIEIFDSEDEAMDGCDMIFKVQRN